MTLIGALRCRDAVILGSDSQETRGRQGRRLARQTRKIYEPRPGFLLAWAGFQDVAQGFALRLERARGLSPRTDRTAVKAQLHRLLAELRGDTSLEGRSDYAEFLIAWFSIPDARPVAVHLRSAGAGEWLTQWAFGGTPLGVDIATFGIGALRFIDPQQLTVEQATIVALKVLRDTVATGADEIGGDVQLGIVAKGRIDVVRPAQMRTLHDTVDLWEAQIAELLPGAVEVPADSTTPDRGVPPPSS